MFKFICNISKLLILDKILIFPSVKVQSHLPLISKIPLVKFSYFSSNWERNNFTLCTSGAEVISLCKFCIWFKIGEL